jgi:hypothetical protein
MLHPGAHREQTGVIQVSHQAHGFPGAPETTFYLRTDWDKVDIFPQGAGDKAVPAVAAVKAHLLPQQTGTDSQLYFFRHNNFFLAPIYNI